MLRRGSLLALLLVAGAIGCSNDIPSDPGTGTPPYVDTISAAKAQVLCGIAGTVIVPTMRDVDRRVGELIASLEALAANRSESTLEHAREAWRAARRPWSNCESFTFGLISYPAIDGQIDALPVEIGSIGSLLEGNQLITLDVVSHLPAGMRGFHAVEYLLYGEDGGKVVDEFTDRQLTYLVAVAKVMSISTSRLWNGWKPFNGVDSSTGDWQLCNAGRLGSIYVTQDEALREILGQLIHGCSDLENRLTLDANNQGEDRFSGNGKSDNLSAVEGIRAIYTGEYSQSADPDVGIGLSALVREKSPAIDSTMRSQLEDAALTVFVAPEVGYDPARDVIRDLRRTIQSQVVPLLVMTR